MNTTTTTTRLRGFQLALVASAALALGACSKSDPNLTPQVGRGERPQHRRGGTGGARARHRRAGSGGCCTGRHQPLLRPGPPGPGAP